MKTENRFKNAREYLQSGNLPEFAIDALEPVVVKRRGIYSIRKTAPKCERDYLAWRALHIAKHAASWGNLSAWREGDTARLMMASTENQEFFHKVFDSLMDAAMAAKKA